MSKMEEMALDNRAFDGMTSLQYLKVFNSLCPRHGEAQCNSNLNLPDELVFPKDNVVRYFDWMNFPGKELSSHLEPKNLIDLRLPYSKITSLWSGAKVCISIVSNQFKLNCACVLFMTYGGILFGHHRIHQS